MFSSRVAARPLKASRNVMRVAKQVQQTQRQFISHDLHASSNRRSFNRVATAVSLSVAAGYLYFAGYPQSIHAEGITTPAEIQFEEKRQKASTSEGSRDLISSQHLQVKRSWEHPGVYAWGSNAGRVVAPDSDESIIRNPRRISYFDGQLLRDIKLDRYFGAAVTEKGDLLQWGIGYSPDIRAPVMTLCGKNIRKIAISQDRILALSGNGTVYSVPVSESAQESGPKLHESTWVPFWSTSSKISYRKITIDSLGWGERVSDVCSGLDHCLLLTNSGRLFSAASSTEDFPSKGQLGIPGLTFYTRPAGPYDQPHEINTLKGFKITKIATGDYHSVALDNQGRVFTFGDNSLGQLGFEASLEVPIIDAPSLLPIGKLYAGTNLRPRVTNIAAGGTNTFFTVDATRVAGQSSDDTSPSQLLGRVTADTWACGQGIRGGLGNGRWTHIQDVPTKVKALSGLFEYDEKENTTIPIRLAQLSVGSTHASAIMNNLTQVDADSRGSESETNWGADVLWWGGNEFYQLGTGRRNNLNTPAYIAPLDSKPDKEKGRREEHRFQITPRKQVRLQGRSVEIEQRVECGRDATAVYSGV